jgi:hypothetical protein
MKQGFYICGYDIVTCGSESPIIKHYYSSIEQGVLPRIAF